MPAPTVAILLGPNSSVENFNSAPFTIAIDQPAQAGGVSCPVSSSNGGDMFTVSPVVIPLGQMSGTFRVNAATIGSRNILLGATTPSLTVSGSPILLVVIPHGGPQQFEQALVAKLATLGDLTAIVGTSIFKSFVPQTHDLQRNGPALTYMLPTKVQGHSLVGSNGTAVARVQMDMWGLGDSQQGAVKFGIEAIRSEMDGPPTVWGDGSCVIMSVVQQTDGDLDEEPEAGSDQVLYHSMTEYAVKYRVSIPVIV